MANGKQNCVANGKQIRQLNQNKEFSCECTCEYESCVQIQLKKRIAFDNVKRNNNFADIYRNFPNFEG